jgi:Ca-activated chloride channel family protein
VTIAKDVKIQVNFNKHRVNAYRLIGYVNRKLRKEDFNNDKKDAGEIGAGHTVTALYEVVPAGTELPGLVRADEDKYSDPPSSESTELNTELLTVRLRYKLPDGETSFLLETPVKDSGRKLEAASDDYKFAAAVAGFGMLLRDSKHRGNLDYSAVIKLGTAGAGKDPDGYRKEFLSLVGKAKAIDKRKLPVLSTAPAGKSSPEMTQF